MKAGNTLDTVVMENGKGVVRHYLQDVGSTFGSGALAPREYDEGSEYLFEGDTAMKRLLTLGFYIRPWQTVPYGDYASVGRFEGDRFDPTTWKPHTPTTAYVDTRPDDAFWAARRVMAFSDDLIRAAVKTGGLTEKGAEEYFADALIKRRNAIGRVYLTALNPVVDPKLNATGLLTFGNAALQYGLAEAPELYKAAWFTFDNATGATAPIGISEGRDLMLQAPPDLPGGAGSFVRVELSTVSAAHPAWAQPVVMQFTRPALHVQMLVLQVEPAPQTLPH